MEIILTREDLIATAAKHHPKYIERTDFRIPYDYMARANKVTFIDDDGTKLILKDRYSTKQTPYVENRNLLCFLIQ